jgi:NAD(P)-dependent dehydrogenase (short-subunit alcohol dehydrogenase family)
MKTILVTGSSRGIGKEICMSLSKKGHQVFACSRSKIQIPGCKSLIMDPGDLNSIKDTFRYLQDEKILFDGLVNNAGLLVNKPFLEISEYDFQNLAQVNWIGPAMIIQKIVPLFNHGAHVLNISSMGGFQGSEKFPGLVGYSSSKGALVTLTECLQSELGIGGEVIFNAVQTEVLKEAFPDYLAPTSAKQMGDYIADFILFGQKSFVGKVLPVSISTP